MLYEIEVRLVLDLLKCAKLVIASLHHIPGVKNVHFISHAFPASSGT